MTSPRIHALRFRIWAHCKELGWNTTTCDAADALGENRRVVAKVARDAGWANRFRTSKLDRTAVSHAGSDYGASTAAMDGDFSKAVDTARWGGVRFERA